MITKEISETINKICVMPWSHIIVHHSATIDGITNDWASIKRYHTEVKKWDDIGYHFGLEFDELELVYKIGRSLDMQGAHTQGMNTVGIGICVVGDFDNAEPSHRHYTMTAELCALLMQRFKIPIVNVHPHWVYAQKTCPGKMFSIPKLREYIRGVTLS